MNLKNLVVILLLSGAIVSGNAWAGDLQQEENFNSIPGFPYFCKSIEVQADAQHSIIDCYNTDIPFTLKSSVVLRFDKGGPAFECLCHDHYWYCNGTILAINGSLLKVSCQVKAGQTVELKINNKNKK